nr:HK97 family phage prohead protease [uncultured Roseateles sp.]
MLELRDAGGTREVRAYALTIKAAGDDGAIEGFGSMFGVRDSYDDIIVPGAFKLSLAEHKAAGTMPAMLWQHDSSEPIGVWTEMVEDDKGLRVKGQLALATARGKEAHALLKMGALSGLSIGFRSIPGTAKYVEDGVRILSQLELWEVSLVTFPANGKARVTNVKAADAAGINTIRQAEQALRDAGYSSDAAKAFIASVKRIVLDERDAHEAGAAMKAANRLLSVLNTNP